MMQPDNHKPQPAPDPLGGDVETVTTACAEYYRALLRADVPDELARTLVMDYHWVHWLRTYWPHTPPMGRPATG